MVQHKEKHQLRLHELLVNGTRKDSDRTGYATIHKDNTVVSRNDLLCVIRFDPSKFAVWARPPRGSLQRKQCSRTDIQYMDLKVFRWTDRSIDL